MEKLMSLAAQTLFIWYFGIVGDVLLTIGIVTAAIGTTIGGFTPMMWFSLAIACYLGIIWVVTMRILARLENRV